MDTIKKYLSKHLKKNLRDNRLHKSFEETYNYFNSLVESYTGEKYDEEMEQLLKMLDEGFYYFKDSIEFQPVMYRPIDLLNVEGCIKEYIDFWHNHKNNRLSAHMIEFSEKFEAFFQKIYYDNFYSNLVDIMIEFQHGFTIAKCLFTNVNIDVVFALKDIYEYMSDIIEDIDNSFGVKYSALDKFCNKVYTQCISFLSKQDTNNIPAYIIKFSDNLVRFTETEEFKLVYADTEIKSAVDEFADLIKTIQEKNKKR